MFIYYIMCYILNKTIILHLHIHRHVMSHNSLHVPTFFLWLPAIYSLCLQPIVEWNCLKLCAHWSEAWQQSTDLLRSLSALWVSRVPCTKTDRRAGTQHANMLTRPPAPLPSVSLFIELLYLQRSTLRNFLLLLPKRMQFFGCSFFIHKVNAWAQWTGATWVKTAIKKRVTQV